MRVYKQAIVTTEALRMAWSRRRREAGLEFHSDRGSQACCREFQAALTLYGVRKSMSGCWDNASTESLWGAMKVGRLYGRRLTTRREAMDRVIDWPTFYNHRKLHSTLSYVSPTTFKQRWIAVQQQDRKCAWQVAYCVWNSGQGRYGSFLPKDCLHKSFYTPAASFPTSSASGCTGSAKLPPSARPNACGVNAPVAASKR